MIFNVNPFQRKTLCALIVIGAGVLPVSVLAEDVVLKSADGSVNIVGEFLEFADDHYLLRTDLGDLRIAASHVSCIGDACPSKAIAAPQIKFAGSDTVGLGLMPQLMSGYAAYMNAADDTTKQDGLVSASLVENGVTGTSLAGYNILATTSDDAFKSLRAGTAEIGMASRRIKKEEARRLKAAGAGDMKSPEREHLVAVDSIVVITHPSNPVNDLSIDQLKKIYSGAITNWSQLGGKDTPIVLISRQKGSGTRSVFEKRLFAGKKAKLARGALIANDNVAATDMVNEAPGAISYVGYGFKDQSKPLALVNECGMRTTADAFSAKTEEYAFQRRLYLYSRGDNLSENAADFLAYAESEKADEVVAQSGFIDLGITRRQQTADGERAQALRKTNAKNYETKVMREMMPTMIKYDRLSTTFRFRTGSTTLDERGDMDMSRLATYLETMPVGTKVLFVGFSDSVGSFSKNRALSKRRANLMKESLVEYAGDRLSSISIKHEGFGEVAPTACNTHESGRRINRRVEVWIEKAAQS